VADINSRANARINISASAIASAGAPGSLQQQSIQRQAREDRDWVLHVEAYPLSRRTDQLAVFNRIAFASGFRQKRILAQSFVRDSAAAGLLPGKLFVKEKDAPASFRQQRTSQSARWTASDNRNRMLRIHAVVADFPA
jgi:hypothetical protein